MITEIIKDEVHYLETIVTDEVGNGVSGLTINYTLYKSLDDSVISNGTLTDIGNGIYKKNITITETGQYYIIYSTPSYYENKIENILVLENSIDSQTVYIQRILGLTKENYKVINPSYNTNGKLISATIKTYPTASDYDADTNTLGIYSFNASYDSENKTLEMGIKKVG